MKRSGKLLLLLAVLAVLGVGAYAAIKLGEQAEAREKAAESTEKETYAVEDISAEDVTKISWQFKDTNLSFTKENGAWVNTRDAAFPVNESMIESQIKSVTAITTGKEIQNTADKSQFGFDSPALTVVLNDDIEYVFGNGTNLMQGRYLLLGGKVYIVNYKLADPLSTGETLCLTEADVLLYDEVPEMAYVIEYKADCPKEDFHVDLIYVTQDDDEHSGIFYIRDDMKRTISQDQTISLVNNIYVTKFQHCVNYNASEEDLKEYGLDEPVMTIWLKFVNKAGETGEYTLYLGNAADENGKYYYAKLPDSKMVYAYDGYIYDNVLLKTYDYLEEKAQYDAGS